MQIWKADRLIDNFNASRQAIYYADYELRLHLKGCYVTACIFSCYENGKRYGYFIMPKHREERFVSRAECLDYAWYESSYQEAINDLLIA